MSYCTNIITVAFPHTSTLSFGTVVPTHLQSPDMFLGFDCLKVLTLTGQCFKIFLLSQVLYIFTRQYFKVRALGEVPQPMGQREVRQPNVVQCGSVRDVSGYLARLSPPIHRTIYTVLSIRNGLTGAVRNRPTSGGHLYPVLSSIPPAPPRGFGIPTDTAGNEPRVPAATPKN